MRQRLTRISKLLRRAELSMDKANMREDVARFYDTGKRPATEPASTFVTLLEAFDKLTDASVGGNDYDQAVAEYERACKQWDQAERGIRWTG